MDKPTEITFTAPDRGRCLVAGEQARFTVFYNTEAKVYSAATCLEIECDTGELLAEGNTRIEAARAERERLNPTPARTQGPYDAAAGAARINAGQATAEDLEEAAVGSLRGLVSGRRAMNQDF